MDRLRSIFPIIICLCLTACIVLPVPTAKRDPEPFAHEALATITVGQTTRDEVLTLPMAAARP